jgi:hypothetical protein
MADACKFGKTVSHGLVNPVLPFLESSPGAASSQPHPMLLGHQVPDALYPALSHPRLPSMQLSGKALVN